MERNKVQHLRSDIKNTTPLPTKIEYGEIAINYAKGSEKIFIKNSENEITEFVTKEQLIGLFYPVGSIYLTINNVNPGIIFGFGEWEQIKDKFLLSAGDTYSAGSTGGESAHTLAYKELPKTNGKIIMHHASVATNIHQVVGCFTAGSVVQGKYRQGGTLLDSDTVSIGEINFSNGGEDVPHNNMPPYLTVYMWKRIS
jgi:hypothetical protein